MPGGPVTGCDFNVSIEMQRINFLRTIIIFCNAVTDGIPGPIAGPVLNAGRNNHAGLNRMNKIPVKHRRHVSNTPALNQRRSTSFLVSEKFLSVIIRHR